MLTRIFLVFFIKTVAIIKKICYNVFVKLKCFTKRGRMKLVKDEQMAKLFDLYQNILTETQKVFLQDFIYRDLTLSEIAENNMISRQAASDAINKGIARIYEMEEKIGFLKTITCLEEQIEKLERKVKL